MPTDLDTGGWAVSWRMFGACDIAPCPNEFEARSLAQVLALISGATEMQVLPPIGPLDLNPEQVAWSAQMKPAGARSQGASAEYTRIAAPVDSFGACYAEAQH